MAQPSGLIRRPGGIANRWIVVLNPAIPSEAVEGIAKSLAKSYGGRSETTYSWTIRGFVFVGSEEQATAMLNDPRIEFIEQDALISHGASRISGGTVWTHPPPPNQEVYMWHLDRLDEVHFSQRDHQYNMCNDAATVYAYVVDTGVQKNHNELTGRVSMARDFSDDRWNQNVPSTLDLTNGCASTPDRWHGTSVASTLAGVIVGASRARVVSLKIFRCSDLKNATSQGVAALDWIRSPDNPYRNEPGVVNLSGFVPPWNSAQSSFSLAAEAVVNYGGFPFFTSADNFGADACLWAPNDRAYTYPGDPDRIFVVGGTGIKNVDEDHMWKTTQGQGWDKGSNAGSCVGVFAPGVDIYTARNESDQSYHVTTGTSFASPLAAAVGARYIEWYKGVYGSKPTATAVYDFLLGQAMQTVNDTGLPEHWICVDPANDGDYQTSTWEPNPSDPDHCFPSVNGPTLKFHSPFIPSTNAKMLYWDQGVCP